MWRRENPQLVGLYIGAATMENGVEFPQKSRTAVQLSNTISGHLSEEDQNPNS